ncbi:hypothetical protein CXG81DRAFT_18527 [Caulochytrium protostelioides]|uniref:PCI domain-containing protein n=1 Tax=Caulochytrium protostelioides TaxID=1555241 RepID=A0A4P9X8R5_9FUNG|nr:hypothetical protein CXG81DRAFT_18527 [Caulochytrium protostelioides]|eukprot:RKP01707.1 hypothetical protein CXG81DRAFT_18527 [Caulochytrium protostelioides]
MLLLSRPNGVLLVMFVLASAYQEVMNPDRNNRDLLYLRAYVGKLGNQSPSSALTSTQIKKARAITHAIDLAVAKELLTKHMHLKAFKKELAEWSEFFNYLHFVMLRKESLSTKNLEAQSASDRATAEKKLALLSVLFLSSVDIRVAIEFLHRIPHPETHDPEIHHCTFHSTLRKMREIMPRGSSAALWNCRLKTAYSSALVHDQHAILDQFFKKLGSYAASFELTKALANSQQGSIKLASDDFERTYSLADTVHKFSQVLKKESEVIARLEQKGIFNFETAHEPHRGDFVRFAIQSAVALSRLNVIGLSSADPTTGLHFVGVSDTDVQKFTDFMEYTLKPTSRWPTFRFQRQPSQCVTCELTRSRQSHGKSKSSTVVTVTADE